MYNKLRYLRLMVEYYLFYLPKKQCCYMYIMAGYMYTHHNIATQPAPELKLLPVKLLAMLYMEV